MGDKANSTICLGMSALLLLTLCVSTMGKTIYVDGDAAGANDGTSWENAYTFLQEALADADLAEKLVEIRVAQGIYRPNEGLMAIPEFDWRTTTFQLVNGTALKGGYAGFGEPDPDARDIGLYETILSGDLLGNDGPEFTNNSENSYHVLTADGTDGTAVVDGCTVMAGNANAYAYPHDCGGGICIKRGGGPTVFNCTFINNLADWGGGIFIGLHANPELTACNVNGNVAHGPNAKGGGIYCEGWSYPTISDCKISGNVSKDEGGGVYCENNSLPAIHNCVVRGNRAENGGGGVYCDNSSNPTIANCVVTGNWTGYKGGGMYSEYCNPHVTGCTISSNIARINGGGICSGYGSSPTLSSCIVWGNIAPAGSQISLTDTDSNHLSELAVWYCDVQGGERDAYRDESCTLYWRAGNIDSDPRFVAAGYWDPNGTTDNPNDDYWVNGDYHLKSEAGRWDSVGESWVVDDVTSPCIDAGDPNSPVGDEPMPHGERINMGAYGGTSEASMSLSDAGEVVYIQWLGHASVKLWTEDAVVYVDPRNLSDSPHDATLVLVTHTHGDHYQPADIAKVSNPQTEFIAPPDVVQRYGQGQAIAPGQTIEVVGVPVTGVAAYNTNKSNHPKSRNWVGFIIELGSKRIYVAGDTDLTDEMKALEDIDVAILPAGGTYTMNAVEAAEATQYIRPELAVPYHWGDIIGSLSDAETFARLAQCAVKILTVGETISSENWPEYSPLIALREKFVFFQSTGNAISSIHAVSSPSETELSFE